MTVYIEYVLLDNLVIDYLLLKASHKIAGVTARKGRLLFCSAAGAVVAAVYPLFADFKVLTVAIKLFCGLFISLLSAKFRNKREFFITFILFIGLTFLTGGAITGIYDLFDVPYSSEISVALMIAPAYIIISGVTKTVKFIYKRKDLFCATYRVELRLNGKKIEVTGFMDTGNGVYDGDSPVIFCGEKIARRLLFETGGKKPSLKKITVCTVNGKEEKICFRLDGISIYLGETPNIFNNVTVCVSDKGLDAGYDVILHPAFLPKNKVA